MSTTGLVPCQIIFHSLMKIARFPSKKKYDYYHFKIFSMFIIDVFFEFNLDFTRHFLETPEACNFLKVTGEN